MIRRLSSGLLVALVGVALLAGCGSSSSSSSSSGSTSSSTTTGAASTPAVAAAVEKCKQGVSKLPTLSQSTKSRLESICDKAASGDENAARTAAREACEEIVKSSPLPDGVGRTKRIEGCKDAESK